MSSYRLEYECDCGDGRRMTVDSEGGDIWIKTFDPEESLADAISAGVLLRDPIEVEALRDQLTDWLLRNK